MERVYERYRNRVVGTSNRGPVRKSCGSRMLLGSYVVLINHFQPARSSHDRNGPVQNRPYPSALSNPSGTLTRGLTHLTRGLTHFRRTVHRSDSRRASFDSRHHQREFLLLWGPSASRGREDS